MRHEFLILTLLAAGAAAQSEADALARARVVEEVEHDLGRAATLYTEIAESAADSTVASRAWLRLADVQAKRGDLEAAQAALEHAAAGEGPAAQEAQRRVRGQDGDGQALELIAQLRRGKDVAADLVWLGRVAAVPLATWVDRDRVDLGFVTTAAKVLVQIGGPDVVAWLGRVQDDYSPLERRAVLLGTTVLRPHLLGNAQRRSVDPALVAALRGFTSDPDSSVLEDALYIHPSLFTATRLTDLLGHEKRGVRQRARGALTHWDDLRGDESIAVKRRLLEQLRARRDGIADEELESIAARVFDRYATAADRELWLDALSLGVKLPTPRRDEMEIAADEHVTSVLEAARGLGPVDESQRAQTSLAVFLARCLGSWTRASISEMLELLDLGYGNVPNLGFSDWFERIAERDDWPAIFARVGAFAGGSWLRELEFEPSPAAFVPLREYALHQLAAPAAKASEIFGTFRAIVRVGTAEALDWVAGYACAGLWESNALDQDDRSGMFTAIARELILAPDSAAVRGALASLARCARSEKSVASDRYDVLLSLVERGERESVSLIANTYEDRPVTTSRSNVPLLRRVVIRAAIDPELVAAILDACLATGNPQAWLDLDTRPNNTAYESFDWERSPWPVARVVLQHGARAPAECRQAVFREVLDHPRLVDVPELLFDALRNDDPVVRRIALAVVRRKLPEDARKLAVVVPLLDDPDWVVARDAIACLGEIGGPRAVELVAPFLEHENAEMRARALRTLACDLDPEHAVDWALRVAEDRARKVRVEICDIADDTLDRRLVPVLIEMLPDSGLRERAQKTLDAIRYYHDEKARWQRILDGTDLGASSAAEALVIQARDGDDREVRVAAVRSLGTLGVPETLPFLITLMRDPDEEVAVAARAAIEKINAR